MPRRPTPCQRAPRGHTRALGIRRLARTLGATAALTVLTALSAGTAAGQVMVNPVVIELGAHQRAAAVSVTLSSKARTPMRLQAELLRWEQDLDGQPVLRPSDTLLVTPSIADLQPGAVQLFRVTLRGTRPAPGELAYRLILEDIAEPDAATGSGPDVGVRVHMRYDLPVLLAAPGPVVNRLLWKPCPAPDAAAMAATPPLPAAACVRLFNAGNRRVKVQTLVVEGDGWQQRLVINEGDNVLVGSERAWRLPLQAGQVGALRAVQVLTARGETLQAEASGF